MPEQGGRRGRKRSKVAETAVLTAAYELLIQEGLHKTTVEAIANRAGVSKATIYKWWPNRASVIMSAFLQTGRIALPYPEQFDAESVASRLGMMAREFQGPIGRMICVLIAESQADPEIAQAFRDGNVLARRKDGLKLIEEAIERGELRDADPNIVLDLLYAPLYYRLLVGHQPLSEEFIRQHTELVLNGIAGKRADRSEDA